MIVVSDTSPITALLAVERMELLKQLFGEVVIPNAVETELRRTHPALPAWLRVQPLQNSAKANLYARSVDRGEAEAIALAEELHADHLLIDERKGRRLAQQQGLPVVGLLGVVLLARRAKLIPSAQNIAGRIGSRSGNLFDR